MTLTKNDLRDWEKSAFTLLNPEQEQAILERFGTEPDPHVWTEQDIAVQVTNFLRHGEFVKPVKVNGSWKPRSEGVF
jgi:hypothetical protein